MGGSGMSIDKPALAMVALQFLYAGQTLLTRAALLEGLSPRVFVVYRQCIATLFFAPFAFASFRFRGDSRSSPLRLKTFGWILIASFLGVTLNQNLYFEGLYLSSSTVASSITNLIPAVTFVMALPFGLEKVNVRSVRSMAKIIGTLICVGGAISMALHKGPNLTISITDQAQLLPSTSLLLKLGTDKWLLGCFLLMASCFSWSSWMIMQVPISAAYPNHLNSSTLMCLVATMESTAIALVLEKDVGCWSLNSGLQIAASLYAGIGLAVSFFLQAWCISEKGPLFCAMFNPLCTLIVTAFAVVFLQEQTSPTCLMGAIGVIVGLYVVLWGKDKEMRRPSPQEDDDDDDDDDDDEQIHRPDKSNYQHMICDTITTIDLEEPLLLHKPPA